MEKIGCMIMKLLRGNTKYNRKSWNNWSRKSGKNFLDDEPLFELHVIRALEWLHSQVQH